MTKLLLAALVVVMTAAWTEGPATERELDRRIEVLHDRKDDHKDAIRALEKRIERREERIDALRAKIHIFEVQDGWVAALVDLRECESGGNYRESPSEGAPGHDGAYQYDRQTWAGAYGCELSYLCAWYYQDALTALKLQNGESWRWACSGRSS